MILIPIVVFGLLAFGRHWSGPLLASVLSPGDILALNRGLSVAMITAVSVLADGLVRHFYWHRYWHRRRGRETPALIRDMMTIAIVVLGLSIALWWIEGLSFTGLVTASGATAIILGIALQAVIQDLFSGLSINLEGSYALGDWLTVYGEHMPEPAYGQVTAMTWRSTYLTLLDGRCLMVPNHLVTANAVLNHSRTDGPKRLQIDIPVDSRVPPAQVIDLLLGEALRAVRSNSLAAAPAPAVHIHEIKSDSTTYKVLFYADPLVVAPDTACSIMLHAVLDALQRNALPGPVTQVEMTPKPKLVLHTSAEQVEEILGHAGLFRSLNPLQRTELAARCIIREFQAGQVLMHQGGTTAAMFILIGGAARVSVAGAGGTDQEVAVLAMGDVAGEMTLMTGAPRTATVAAMTHLRALEIDKDAVAPLLQQSPELMQDFSEILAERQKQLHALANRPVAQSIEAHDILSRIRSFFSARRS